MRGKTVVITGGTSGIGEVAAEILAKKGARIVLVARDKTRGVATLVRLRNSARDVAHSVYIADLTHLAEMKRVATQIADQEQRIDVLINNAGDGTRLRPTTPTISKSPSTLQLRWLASAPCEPRNPAVGSAFLLG
jgi:short-subunit dehydrogenase